MAAAATKTLIIGSRGSQLALWQANYVAKKLAELDVSSRIEIIKTTGDHLQTASLVQGGGKGLFTKEIEEALLAGSIDVAVHSLKDLPTQVPACLNICAIPPRGDARDALVGSKLSDLMRGARVGTSSGRRAAQLRAIRPDLRIEAIRGNVDTRLRKLREGQYDAIMLAAAGLKRLGLDGEITEFLEPEQVCPAAGQGALAIETRCNDTAEGICRRLNHQDSSIAVACERAALAALGGGCELPVGAFAQCVRDNLSLMAAVVAQDGSRRLRAQRTGPSASPEDLGRAVAGELLAQGARSILAETK